MYLYRFSTDLKSFSRFWRGWEKRVDSGLGYILIIPRLLLLLLSVLDRVARDISSTLISSTLNWNSLRKIARAKTKAIVKQTLPPFYPVSNSFQFRHGAKKKKKTIVPQMRFCQIPSIFLIFLYFLYIPLSLFFVVFSIFFVFFFLVFCILYLNSLIRRSYSDFVYVSYVDKKNNK